MGNKEFLSVVIPHVPGKEHDERLLECVASLKDYDELIIVTNEIGTLGFTKAVNTGLSIARGDYVAVVNNDIVLEGNIRDMCKNAVVSPKMNGKEQYFWGCFFVIPRKVLETVGYLDEQFYLYCSDTDYVLRCKEARVKVQSEPSCNVITEGGRTCTTIPERTAIEEEDANKFFTKWGRLPNQAL